jgi:RHS repeat-associated protein
VKRTINGTTTYLIYDGWNLVAEYNAAGTLTTQYIHGPQVDEILAKVTPTSTTFPLPDALGSTIAVTDASGAVLERVFYSGAFGSPTFKDASDTTLAGTSTGTRFLFTGREWLAAFSLYDYRNRTYSAELGRFIETDPIGFNAGDANLYRYVDNSPVTARDPTGLVLYECTSPAFSAGGALGNHTYFYDSEKGRCERFQSSGDGAGTLTPDGAPKPGDSCQKVLDQSKAEKLWECCSHNANTGQWVPVLNDCHSALDRCYKAVGTTGPNTPRFGKCCTDES